MTESFVRLVCKQQLKKVGNVMTEEQLIAFAQKMETVISNHRDTAYREFGTRGRLLEAREPAEVTRALDAYDLLRLMDIYFDNCLKPIPARDRAKLKLMLLSGSKYQKSKFLNFEGLGDGLRELFGECENIVFFPYALDPGFADMYT